MEKTEGGSKPVMARVPWPMYKRLQAIAKGEATSVATVLRRVAMERLNEKKPVLRAGRNKGMRWVIDGTEYNTADATALAQSGKNRYWDTPDAVLYKGSSQYTDDYWMVQTDDETGGPRGAVGARAAAGVSTSAFQQFKDGAAGLFHPRILAIEALSSATYLILAGAALYPVVRGLGIGNASFWQVLAPLRNRWMERSDLDEPRKVLAAHEPGCLVRWEEARCESTGMVGTLVQAALPGVITR